jgi:hypothetical protein
MNDRARKYREWALANGATVVKDHNGKEVIDLSGIPDDPNQPDRVSLTPDAMAELADQIRAEKRAERAFETAIRAFGAASEENMRKDLTRKAIAELADPKFEPRNPGRVIGRIDDPAGPESRQQVAELEELLKYQIQVALIQQAHGYIDRWLHLERLNNRPVPELEPTVRTKAARLVAAGEYVPDALQLAKASKL